MLLRVIDTGGLETPSETEKSSLLQSMQEQVWRAVAEAQAILFVIDAQEGVRSPLKGGMSLACQITPADLHIAGLLREGGHAEQYRELFKTETPREVPSVALIAGVALVVEDHLDRQQGGEQLHRALLERLLRPGCGGSGAEAAVVVWALHEVVMSAKQNQGTARVLASELDSRAQEELYDRLLLEVGHLQEKEEVRVRGAVS